MWINLDVDIDEVIETGSEREKSWDCCYAKRRKNRLIDVSFIVLPLPSADLLVYIKFPQFPVTFERDYSQNYSCSSLFNGDVPGLWIDDDDFYQRKLFESSHPSRDGGVFYFLFLYW